MGPALLLDYAPDDLFVIRNVANLILPPQNDGGHHGWHLDIERQLQPAPFRFRSFELMPYGAAAA